MAHNKYYSCFHRMQKERLENKQCLNISSYHLFVHSDYVGIECAMYPILYPSTEFSDTGILRAYKDSVDDNTSRFTPKSTFRICLRGFVSAVVVTNGLWPLVRFATTW